MMDDSMILVVDDYPAIADSAAMVLNREGYSACALYNAADAIAMLREADVALVVSDVNMPGMDGVELALKMRELCPRTGVLLMSGYETTETIGQRPECEGCKFRVLAKPFGARQLLETIKSVVD